MNKGIIILILLVVLGAMGLVMYSHTSSKPDTSPLLADTPAGTGSIPPLPGASSGNGHSSPLLAPQGDSGGLRQIDPPLTGVPSPNPVGRPVPEGAPQPLRFTAGVDGHLPKPVTSGGQTPLNGAAPLTPPPSSSVKPAEDVPVKQPSVETGKPSVGTKPGADKKDAGKIESKTPVSQGAGETKTAIVPQGKTSGGSPGLTPWQTPPGTAGAAKTPSSSQSKTPGNTPAAQADNVKTAGTSASQTNSGAKTGATQQTPPSDKGAHALKNISLAQTGNTVSLRIEADTDFPCKTFVLTGPDRLVIDLPGSWKDMKTPSVPKNSIVKKVRIGQQPAGPRLVLDLEAPLKNHKVQRSGSMVEISVQ